MLTSCFEPVGEEIQVDFWTRRGIIERALELMGSLSVMRAEGGGHFDFVEQRVIKSKLKYVDQIAMI